MTAMTVCGNAPSIFETIGAFAETSEGNADLRIHRDVDSTVEALLAERKFLRGHAVTGRAITENIRNLSLVVGSYLDVEGMLVDTLTELIERDEDYLVTMTAQKGCIDGDRRLNSSHCDMLHSAYDEVLVELACLIEVTKDMRAAIIARDLAAEPRDGPVYENVVELRRAIAG